MTRNSGFSWVGISNFILLTSISEMNSAVAADYAYRGLQGYVFTTQATGTQALYLKCKTSDDDCAIFLEKDRIAFEFAGYTSTCVCFNHGICAGD